MWSSTLIDELGLDTLQSNGHWAKVNQPLAELHFLVMQGEQEKEKRRLVIATLEALVGSNSDRSVRTKVTAGLRRSSGVAGVQELQNGDGGF